jgi:cobalamin biosynthesis protein CobW
MIRFPLPVSVITGFLGAGKTTLLSNLLGDIKQRRLAIVVNEFGEVSIDGALLREHPHGDDVQVRDIANGLLAYGDDASFERLMDELHARRELIDHVVIETSGLAAPTAVMERLQRDPVLAERFVLDATLAVVDTPLLLDGQFDPQPGQADAGSVSDLFRAQLDGADVVVLNKIDGLAKRALIDAETCVRTLAPGVRFIELAHHARLDTRVALGVRLHEPTSAKHAHTYTPVASLQGSSLLSRRLDGHSHSGLAPHVHGLATHKHFHEHDPGWQSFVLRCDVPQDAPTLVDALEQAARAERVMRIKGFVQVRDEPGALLVQGVRTRISAARGDRARDSEPASSNPTSELVFIGYHSARSNVAGLLSRLTGADWH